jgi:hypothetical protein
MWRVQGNGARPVSLAAGLGSECDVVQPLLVEPQTGGETSVILGDYRSEGGDLPAKLPAMDAGRGNSAAKIISPRLQATGVKASGRTAVDAWVLEYAADDRAYGVPATRRDEFFLPPTESTTMISGCRSSVREITGNSKDMKQMSATACNLMVCCASRRDAAQRNRHSQMTANATASQVRLRIVSIISRWSPTLAHASLALSGEGHAPYPRKFTPLVNPVAILPNSNFHSGTCA